MANSSEIVGARFKALTRRPPLEYLTWWRLQRAAANLRSDDVTLNEVARGSGSQSEAVIGKAFRREFVFPPAQLRRQLVKARVTASYKYLSYVGSNRYLVTLIANTIPLPYKLGLLQPAHPPSTDSFPGDTTMNSPVTNTEQKKIAIVTGAGSGIGRAIALGLADAGYNVVLAGRTPEKLNDTIKLAEENTSSFIAIPTDVSQPESVKHLFSETKERFDRLDLLFNNAGINVPAKSIEDVELSDWLKVVNTNLTGMFLCLQGAIRLMKSQNPIGGRIINNGSISAHAPRPGSAPYTATKHAVTGLTKSASLDCRKFNIACGQIDIGNAQTSMAAKMSQGVPQADGSIATEPTMDVEDVTRAVLYMAQLPLDTNVPFMTVMANEMPYIGRG